MNQTPALLIAALFLFIAPAHANPNDPGSGQGHDGGAQGDNQTSDPGSAGHGRHGGDGNSTREDGESDAGEQVNATGSSDNGRPRLDFKVENGHPKHTDHYVVYRGVNEGNLTPYVTVPATQSNFTDTNTSPGNTYRYSVQNYHKDGTPGAQSQVLTTDSFGCAWIVLSPDDVLLHPECIPVVGPIVEHIIHFQ